MTDLLEITDEDGRRRRVPVPGERLAIGSGEGADLRLPESRLEPMHMQLVRVSGGVRVEPCKPGTTFVVDGEDLFCKDLRPGEAAVVEGLRLRWLGDGATSPVAPPRATAAGRTRRGEQAPAARPRLRRRRSWLPVLAITTALVLVALFVIKRLGSSTWPQSPQHFVDLARSQLGNGEPSRALDTLAFALGEAAGDTRRQALELEADIRKMLLEVAAASKVQLARQQHDLLQSFVATYLGTIERPAARECVRLCDRWLERHRAVCEWHGDGKPLLAAIVDMRERYVAAAELSSPESAADVIFAARSRLRFQWRDYREAFERIDAFLARHAEAADVQAERERLLVEGEEWLDKRLRQVDRLLLRGDTDNAEIDLDRLDRWSVIPQWRPLLAPLRKRLREQR